MAGRPCWVGLRARLVELAREDCASMEIDFNLLIEQEADYLFRYARRHFPSEDVAEDLVQETLLAAIESALRFKGESSPRTWLTSILRHKIIDRIRKSGREILRAEEEDAERYLTPYFDQNGHWRQERGPRPLRESPERNLSDKQFLEVLQVCLGKLSGRLRHVFLLREIDGLTPEDICNELGLSATNLRVMLHRARVQLRDCLEKRWMNESEPETVE